MNLRSGREVFEEEIREARPFYGVLYLVLATVYFWALASDPGLRAPQRLIPFTSLLVVHGALHWGALYLDRRPRLILPYFAIQTALVTLVAAVTSGHAIVLGLYLALAGEAAGVREDLRQSAWIVLGIVAVAVLTFGFLMGWSAVPGWLTLIIPTALFVVVYVVMFGRQMRLRQQAQDLLRELETAHRQLGEYAARVEDLTRSAERQRMARELHDTLAQGLAGLVLQLEAADSHLAQGHSDKAQQVVQQAMGRARSTLAGARRAIDDLRTELRNSQDVALAVREEAERFTTATGITCEVDSSPPSYLPGPTAEHALMAVSEGLANVARHARASRVWLSIKEKDGAIQVEVRDNGAGFDPRQQAQEGHYGLIGLRERARLAGGSLKVESTPGQGTSLTLTLPLESDEGDR